MKKRAFTLAEVLVAMAIVVILAALIFTAARSSMELAKASTCVSNLRQIHIGMTLYKESEGEYPPSNEKWEGLARYLGNDVLKCPVRDMAQPSDPPPMRTSYFIHAFFGGPLSVGSAADAACMEERGSSYPVAHDRNHASNTVAYWAKTAFYLFVRADGSVGKKSREAMNRFELTPNEFPCPKAKEWSNF